MTTTGLVGSLTFLLGLLLGNWLAIGRDRRKEFNDAAIPIRAWLLKAKDEPTRFTRYPSDQDFDRFIQNLRPWQRSRFSRHFEHYRAVMQAGMWVDAAGQIMFEDGPELRRDLTKLFKYTKRR